MKSAISDYKATVVVLGILGLCMLNYYSDPTSCYLISWTKEKTERQPYERTHRCCDSHLEWRD